MLVGGALAVMLGLGCVVLAAGSSWPRWSRVDAPAAIPTVDPRLVIVPRTAPIQGALSGGARLRGTLSPAIPGPNTLRLRASDGAGARIEGGRLRLVVTMPGMRMRPIVVTLQAHGEDYSGTLPLPMFGLYRATVVVSKAERRYTGPVTLVLSLPGE